jgi:hypothetical protein
VIVGDIVSLRGRTGKWVYAGPDPNAALPGQGVFLAAVRTIPGSTRITWGEVDAVVTVSPVLTIGETVDYFGQPATVLDDDGRLVALSYTSTLQDIPADDLAQGVATVYVPREVVIQDNISKF